MRRRIKQAIIGLALLLAAAQLVQPDTRNPPVDPSRSLWSSDQVDARVGGVLRRACADCHSNETRWPWYSRVSPISWFVAGHVRDGRAKLNFSNWSNPSSDELEEIYDSIAKNKMPMESYLWIHPDARLSKTNREVLLAWAEGKSARNSH